MKNIFLLGFVSSILFIGCMKETLEKDPIARELSGTYFSLESNATLAINAIYDPLNRVSTYARAYYAFGECRGDLSKVAGGGSNDQQEAQNIMKYTQLSNGTYVTEFFKWNYVGIQRANTAIQSLKNVKYDASKLQGQAYFLRAFYYFDLVRMYGAIPLVTKNISISDVVSNRTADDDQYGTKQIELIYKQIVSDFDSAAMLLPEKWDDVDLGRATKFAALAYLTKVYTTMASNQSIFIGDKSSYWQLAKKNADLVYGKYSLLSDYHKVFLVENSSESIFEVQFAIGTDYDMKAEGTIRTVDQSYRFYKYPGSSASIGYAYGLNCPTAKFLSLFDVENKDNSIGYKYDRAGTDFKKDWDPRLDLIAKPEDSLLQRPEGAVVKWCRFDYPEWKWTIKEPFYGRKCEVPYPNDQQLGASQQSAGNNWVVYRYADFLLLRSEIYLALGDEGTALSSINEVRKRARMSKIDKNDALAVGIPSSKGGIYPKDLTSLSADLIFKERALELGLEYHRFFDLVRSGRAVKECSFDLLEETGPFTRTFVVHRDEFLPIPASVIVEGQGKIVQNSGY